ncbi:hypothetical protein QOT17_011308 [Balamuthia mandrillaris]
MDLLPTIELDGDRINDLDSFFDEVTDKLLSSNSKPWPRTLEAFDKLLGGRRFANTHSNTTNSNNNVYQYHYNSAIPRQGVWRLRWLNSKRSQKQLGYAATVRWLEGRLAEMHPSNRELWQGRLQAAKNGKGDTLFDQLVNMIRQHAPLVEISDEGVILELA